MSIIPSSSSTHVAFVGLSAAATTPESQSNQNSAEIASIPSVPSQSSAKAEQSNNSNQAAKSTAVADSATKQSSKPKLHRIHDARVSQGLSERTICRRLNIDLKQLRALEDPTAEITLSMLLKIRDALDVPFADLLVESDGLSRPVQERAKLLKIMKTAVTIKECNLPPRVTRLAQMLNEQLIELMPELADTGGWPEFGSRRGADSIARVLACEIDTSQLRQD